MWPPRPLHFRRGRFVIIVILEHFFNLVPYAIKYFAIH